MYMYICVCVLVYCISGYTQCIVSVVILRDSTVLYSNRTSSKRYPRRIRPSEDGDVSHISSSSGGGGLRPRAGTEIMYVSTVQRYYSYQKSVIL